MATATRTIEVFRPGSFVALGGQTCTFSADDLKALAAAYDPAGAPAPGVVGHPKTDAPAYAWATAFRFDEASQRLVADMGEIEPAFADQVAAGRYKKISLALFPPDAANNPKPGTWYPKHVGFLGAAAPAVSGLKPVAFSDDDGALVIEFGETARSLKDVAGLFRSLREWLIGEHGQEAADQALPRWSVDWLDDKATIEAERDAGRTPAFSEEEKSMTTKPAGPTAEALDARAAELDKRERALGHADNLAFAEGLVAEGRLLPALKDKAVGLLDFLRPQTEPFEFSEGDKAATSAPADLLRAILKAQPKVVEFGAYEIGEGRDAARVEFAAPEGMQVDPGSLDLHRRAVAYQASHAGASYSDAIAAVNR